MPTRAPSVVEMRKCEDSEAGGHGGLRFSVGNCFHAALRRLKHGFLYGRIYFSKVRFRLAYNGPLGDNLLLRGTML